MTRKNNNNKRSKQGFANGIALYTKKVYINRIKRERKLLHVRAETTKTTPSAPEPVVRHQLRTPQEKALAHVDQASFAIVGTYEKSAAASASLDQIVCAW